MGSVEGKKDKGKGRVKEAIGDLTGNESMKNKGRADSVSATDKNKIATAAGMDQKTADGATDKFARDSPRRGIVHASNRLAPVPESAARARDFVLGTLRT